MSSEPAYQEDPIMKNFFAKILIYLASSALGLLVASFIPGFELRFWGLIFAVLIFTAAQAVLTPLIASLVKRYASALTSLVGVLSTYLALWLSHILPNGLRLESWQAWVFGGLIVWVVTAVATMVFTKLFKD